MKRIIHNIKKYKFKKVDYFDLVIVLSLVIFLVFFLYSKFTKKEVWIDAEVVISGSEWNWPGQSPPYWLVNNFEVGQISYNSFGEDVAKITGLDIFSLGGPYKQAYINLKLKVTYDKNRKIYLYNFQPIQKGKPIDLAFGSSNISGIIVALGEENEDLYNKRLRVRVQHVEDWLANSYEVGMEMRNSEGETLARIDNVEIKPSKIDNVIFLDGGIRLSRDNYKDVYLDITVTASKDKTSEYRFIDGASLKISETIWLHFPEVIAESRIIDILE